MQACHPFQWQWTYQVWSVSFPAAVGKHPVHPGLLWTASSQLSVRPQPPSRFCGPDRLGTLLYKALLAVCQRGLAAAARGLVHRACTYTWDGLVAALLTGAGANLRLLSVTCGLWQTPVCPLRLPFAAPRRHPIAARASTYRYHMLYLTCSEYRVKPSRI